MTYYKLVSSGRSDLNVDEIILTRDDSGDIEDSVSVHQARELSADEVDSISALTGRLKYDVVEAPEPDQGLAAGSQLAELQEIGTIVTAKVSTEAPQAPDAPPDVPPDDSSQSSGT